MQVSTFKGFKSFIFVAALTALITGCSDDDDDDSGGGGNQFNIQSLSGEVRQPSGAGLPGVTVTAGMQVGMTDANGIFIIPSLGQISSSQLTVEFDGSTATAPGTFPLLDVVVELESGVENVSMPQVITLPNLASAASGQQTVNLDIAGAATAPIAVQSMMITNLSLAGPAGTIVSIDGVVGVAASVDINITPVPANQIPMPLPSGLQGSSFVTIQPANAAFDTGSGLGLDIVLPNAQGLPLGATADIWSFDHSVGDWVNRSDQTGQVGTVVDNGGTLEIQATGVITEGGWHTAGIPVDSDCATTIEGRVEDGLGQGIAGASISLATGQFGVSDSNGDFSIPSVPAYDVALLNATPSNCIPIALDYEIVLPPAYGSGSTGTLTVPNSSIFTGGTTTLTTSVFITPTTGTLTGLVTGALNGNDVIVTDFLMATTNVPVNANGSFQLNDLAPGDYTASYQFNANPGPTTSDFTITANTITAVNLQSLRGEGSTDLTVLALLEDELAGGPLTPVGGALVLLFGTDAGSAGGFLATTDVNGEALFSGVDGPFTVTVVKDMLVQGSTVRLGTSLIEIDPGGSAATISALMSLDPDPLPPTLDATLVGDVLNAPTLTGTEELTVQAFSADGALIGSDDVDPVTGAYSIPIPSGTTIDLVLAYTDPAATSPVLASQFLFGQAQVSPGDMPIVDFDFTSSETVAWDQPVDLDITNVAPGLSTFIGIEFSDPTSNLEFCQDLAIGQSTATVNLPDLSNAALSGLTVDLFGGAEDLLTFAAEQECDSYISGSTPSAQSFDLNDLVDVTEPVDGMAYTVAQLEVLNVLFDQGNSNFGNNGANQIGFYATGGTPPNGVDTTSWAIFSNAGNGDYIMPASPVPMFGTGQEIEVEVEILRFNGVNVDYNTFFNENLQSNLDGLSAAGVEECTSSVNGAISTL